MAINPLHPAPTSLPIMNDDGVMPDEWVKYFFNSYFTVNSLAGVSSSSNVLLNGTFNGQSGVTTPVTESDGDGAYVAQIWQVFGANNADYTITSTEYALDDL